MPELHACLPMSEQMTVAGGQGRTEIARESLALQVKMKDTWPGNSSPMVRMMLSGTVEVAL